MSDRVCKHGYLSRSCERCYLESEVDRLKKELDEWHRIAGEQIERLMRERDALRVENEMLLTNVVEKELSAEVERLRALLRETDALIVNPPDGVEPWMFLQIAIRAALGEE